MTQPARRQQAPASRVGGSEATSNQTGPLLVGAERAQAPVRIQRKRTAGWRMPQGVIYVGRPTRWGNPFTGEAGAATMTRQYLADHFHDWIITPTRTLRGREQSLTGCPHFLGVPFTGRPTVAEIRTALAGRDLACWCPVGQPCHADVLLRLANAADANGGAE